MKKEIKEFLNSPCGKYMAKKNKRTEKYTYDNLMDALNIIDEQAEQMGGSKEECEARQKAYNLLADFIDLSQGKTIK